MEETERESSETCMESAEVNAWGDLTRFHLASCLKMSRINGVVKRREDFRAILLDDLSFGVTFLGETASKHLCFQSPQMAVYGLVFPETYGRAL